ncbi:MAG: peptide ABC transporter substrate-binding protein [Candidatus Limnocylindrales bacterium]
MSKRLMGMLCTAVLLFAACSSSATPSPTTPSASQPATTAPGTPAASASLSDLDKALFGSNYAPGPGKPGGTLIMGEWQPALQLNPFFTTSFTDFEAIQPAMRGFLTISSDGKYIPDLAATVPTPENGGLVIDSDGKGMTVNVTLKPNLKWSDGVPLTGEDFAYTVKWAQDPTQEGCTSCGIGFTYVNAQGKTEPLIDKVTVSPDGLSISMHFVQLFSSWLSFLTGPATILPEHYMKNILIANAATDSMPVSAAAALVPWSGPFMITAAGPTEIDYKPNPYWAGGVGGQHAPYLAGLKFQYFTDKAGEIAAFKTGDIDLAFDLSQADAQNVQGTDPSIGKSETTPAWQYEHFDMNLASTNAPFLKDVNVRKAIYESVDKQSIIDAVFPGSGVTPACSNVPPGLWYRTDVTCPSYNPTDAASLLTAAGLPVGSDGMRTYNGKEINLLLCTTAGNSVRLTELQKLEGYLQAVGIKSHIETADAASVVFAGWLDTATTPTKDCEMYRGNYDMVDYAYIIGGSPYSDNDPVYDSSQFPENAATGHNGANDTRFSSPAMDAALKILSTAVDPQAQLNAMVAVQQAYIAGMPEIPLYYRAEVTGVGVHVGNWPGYNPSSIGPTWDPEDWFYQ